MKYASISLFIIILCIIACAGTAEKSVNGKDYYFPYKTFTNRTIYTYVNKNNVEEKIYWEMWIEVEGKDTFFITESYDEKHRIFGYIKEQITSTGAILKVGTNYYYYSNGDTGKVNCTIKDIAVYNWKAEKNKSYTWSESYKWPEDTDSTTLSKTRTFTGDNKDLDFDGKTFDCLIYHDAFEVVTKLGGIPRTSIFSNKSYYAKGLGLIRYITTSAGNPDRDFNLVNITKK
jgi:hypothetical protein